MTMGNIDDDDILLFCCKHSLSVFEEDYTQFELDEMKKASLKEQNVNKNENSLKLKNILNS